MPIQTPDLKLDPYQSQVPILQIPQQDMQPGGPLPQQAGYMGKTGAAAEIGDQILHGFMRGRAAAEQKKSQLATNAINLQQKTEQDAWKNYSDALTTGQAKPGDDKDPAYQAYLKAHQATSETMEKYAIPEDKPKGQKKGQKDQKPKDGEPQQPQSFGQKIGDFLKANPHVIPQLAIASRVPNPPRMTPEMQQQQMALQEGKNQLTLQGQEIDSNKVKQQQQVQAQKDQELRQKVDELGGVDKVAKDKNAPPELQAAARRGVAERLDKEGPDGQLRDKFASDVMSGNSKNWTPADRQMAANLGYATKPQEVEMEKGGKKYLQLIDPGTGQPVAGSKPLYVGPSAASNQMASFFAERNAMRNDLHRAVSENPEQFGISLTGDKSIDDARISAATDRVFIAKEEGIQAQVGMSGNSGFDVIRTNNLLEGVAKELKSIIPADKAGAPGKAQFDWPGEKNKVTLSQEDASRILEQFVTDPKETPGIYTFRPTAKIQTGKDPGAAERDRQWAYQLVRNRMMAQKGKNAMTGAEADAILKNTALGQPIVATGTQPPGSSGGISKPSWWQHEMTPWKDWGSKGSLTPPPDQDQASGTPAGSKYYSVPGQGVFQLTPEEAQKLAAAGYQTQEISPEMMTQFSQ